ncbi:peptidoglycan editing factor PgeF [Vibrio anguillarum]|uniref:Purine nucleoside phosphorylase n=1 Tax=Vibrio anguillarum TaxID=55601 RepID=A0ABD4QR96_VIBAN|nr:peptidoglycan editing factor PgeF [Vibrio anguillarum]MBT2917754.1 peptidoglycan editing factor PgeF [Vibrio anguillarum]
MQKIIPNWNAPKHVKAFSSTRVGGFSLAPYQGLNLGMHVGDDPLTVEKNRQWLTQQAAMPSEAIWLEQTHSTQVLEVTQPTQQILSADGVFTHQHNVVCSVMTADCLPVLLTNHQGSEVAAVHAGWRGLANGILENALAKFSSDILAWLGPAIGPTAFEVGDDVYHAFVDQNTKAKAAFSLQENGKWLANIAQLATLRLHQCGVSEISDSGLCTFHNPHQFYSYRRDGITGRQASFIWIEE